jgi:general secretion pathway protein A
VRVNAAVLDRIHQGKDIVLVINECQNLTFELLEQIRLLSNLETDKQKLLHLILIGQRKFKTTLNEPRLRQ